MAGWTREKRIRVEEQFYAYLRRCFINSKDYGLICLGENLYTGQIYAIGQIFDALEADIHDIYILKSRQLGISTIIRALTTFFLGVFSGLNRRVKRAMAPYEIGKQVEPTLDLLQAFGVMFDLVGVGMKCARCLL